MHRKDISDHFVAWVVEEHWKLLDALQPGDPYPPSPCEVLEGMGIPYKLARAKLKQMQKQGILEYLWTTCVPGREIHWDKIKTEGGRNAPTPK